MLTCQSCKSPTHSYLLCDHILCLPCILNISNGTTVNCPQCQRVSNIETLLVTQYKCARCNIIQDNIHLCNSFCDNYLCSSCWSDIHSFPPLLSHTPAPKNPQHKLDILDQFKAAKASQQQIKETVSQLRTIRQDHINSIEARFAILHSQLEEQKRNIIASIHSVADGKLQACQAADQDLTMFTQHCANIIFDKHATLKEPYPTFSEDLDFRIEVDETFVIPKIATIGIPEPILLTTSGEFIPPVTRQATIVCVGGGGAGGTGGGVYAGGGGSGFISITEQILYKNQAVKVIIGAGGKASIAQKIPSGNGECTQFGDVVAEGGRAANVEMAGGDGGSGGGAVNGLWTRPGGNGGSAGTDGGTTLNYRSGDKLLDYKGGKGHNSEEYEQLKQFNILPGAGGRGGKITPDGYPSGGGGGGVVYGHDNIRAMDGFGPEENNGLGGEGYGAGGGGGSSKQTAHSVHVCKMGGNGAPGCVFVIYH